MKQIKIKIKTNGEIEAETVGMKGKTCLKYIAELERMANAVSDDSDFTREYYEVEEQEVINQIQEVTE